MPDTSPPPTHRMVDIHSHILPNLDDGATALSESVAMARQAVADGIGHIFCTPHHHWARCDLETMRYHVDKVQLELNRQAIPLQLYTGSEIHLYSKTLRDWYGGTALALGESRYVLAEPKFNDYGAHTDDLLRMFFDEGYTPIMAHPERIKPIQENIGLLEWFIEAGGRTQLTAESLTREPEAEARVCAEALLRNGMVHIIASDAHGLEYRPIGLSQACKAAAAIVGEETALAMVTHTPYAIVEAARPHISTPSSALMDG